MNKDFNTFMYFGQTDQGRFCFRIPVKNLNDAQRDERDYVCVDPDEKLCEAMMECLKEKALSTRDSDKVAIGFVVSKFESMLK